MINYSLIKKDKLAISAIIVTSLWIFIQIVLLIVSWNHPQTPDAVEYTSRALFAYKHHVFYPSIHNINDRFTHAPGLVNFYLLIYAIFRSFKPILIINLLMNIVIIYEVFYIANHFFNKKVGYVSIIIYSTIISTWFVPLHYLSDHPSYFLFITGFCLTIQRKWYWVILGSICYALSYTIRPSVLAYLLTSITVFIIYKRYWLYYLYLFIPYFGILYGIGKYFENSIGIYTNTSHILGYGMMHSANEDTWAGPNMGFDNNPKNSGYIANAKDLTFAEKDSIWKSRSVKWIKENPKRYIGLAPQRFFRSFALDSWSFNDVFEKDAYGKAVTSKNPNKALMRVRMTQFAISIPYYLMITLFIFSMFYCKKNIFTKKGIILLITLIYVGTTFFLEAEHRMHYAFLFPMMIWAAYGIVSYYNKKQFSYNS